MTLKPETRIFVALDTIDLDWGLALARGLKGLVGGMKIGKEFFTALGPEGVRKIQEVKMPIFLDLKFHDIPNTVAGAVHAAIPLRPAILNVHAAGGRAMMEAACEASAAESQRLGVEKPLVFLCFRSKVVRGQPADNRHDFAGAGEQSHIFPQNRPSTRIESLISRSLARSHARTKRNDFPVGVNKGLTPPTSNDSVHTGREKRTTKKLF